MSKVPIEQWGILILEKCSPSQVNQRERYWIRKLSPTLNVRDIPTFSNKWEMLLRAKIVEPTPDRKPLSQAVHELTSGLGKHVSLPEALRVLKVAPKNYPPDIANQIFQCAQNRILKLCDLKVPQRLVLHVPQLRGIHSPSLREALSTFISTLPLPVPLRSYLASTISAVAKRGSTIRDLLCARTIGLSMEEMADQSTRECECAKIAGQHGLHLVDGHIVGRHPKHIRALFGHSL